LIEFGPFGEGGGEDARGNVIGEDGGGGGLGPFVLVSRREVAG
jgi:hypothetical protein